MTKLAIVTGAGQGIGESIAFRLAKDGFAIGVADINSVTGEEVAHALVEAGYEAKFYQVDVAHRDEVFQLNLLQCFARFVVTNVFTELQPVHVSTSFCVFLRLLCSHSHDYHSSRSTKSAVRTISYASLK